MTHPATSSPKPTTTFPVSHVLRARVINYTLQNEILPAQQKEKSVPTALFCTFVLKGRACAAEQGTLQNIEKKLDKQKLKLKDERNRFCGDYFWSWLTLSKSY